MYPYEIPMSLNICDTLVSLELHKVARASAEFVSLSCLKTVHLHDNMFPNEATFEARVSCRPVLEQLKVIVVGNYTKVYRVHSRSLKRLTFSSFEFDSNPEVVIDAPLLCGLKIIDGISKIIITNILESIAKLDISLNFGWESFDKASVLSWRSRIRSFLPKISKVMDMTISKDTFEVIHHYSKLEPLPQFGCMSRLCVSLHAPDLKWLTTFLESSPNLKSLVLLHVGCKWDMESKEMNQISFSSVPKVFAIISRVC